MAASEGAKPQNVERIYSYLDYRQFLRDRFRRLKRSSRATHRSLSKKAGFASPNFLKLVMEGERNLSERSISQIAAAFDLNEREREFFAALVRFNQAKELEEKEILYQELKLRRPDLSLKRLEHSQFEYLKDWHTVAIREMVALEDFREDPEWIAERLGGRVRPAQVKRSLKLLSRLGLLGRNAEGRLVPNQAPLSSGDEVSSLAAYSFHQGMLEQAKRALRETPPELRDISSVTLAVDAETLQKVKRKIQAFRKEILAMSEGHGKAEAIYQMNIQLFNLSEGL